MGVMIRPMHILPDLLGKIAHLHHYAERFDAKKSYNYDRLIFFQDQHMCKMFFRFVDHTPWFVDGYYFYCLEDSEFKDWYWLNLNQLIICTD